MGIINQGGISVPAQQDGRETPPNYRHMSKTTERVFSTPGVDPFEQVKWEKRTAAITDDRGKVIFNQENVEVPDFWSHLATKVVVSKYFYGEPGQT